MPPQEVYFRAKNYLGNAPPVTLKLSHTFIQFPYTWEHFKGNGVTTFDDHLLMEFGFSREDHFAHLTVDWTCGNLKVRRFAC